MRKKRIQYNELTEEIYERRFWSRPIIIFLGMLLLLIGFLANFSLEDRLDKFISTTLEQNPSCPMHFEKLELSYLLPKMTFKKINIKGICFGNPQNNLQLDTLILKMELPSLMHLGFRFGIDIKSQKELDLKLSPILSFGKMYIEIEDSKWDAKILRILNAEGKSIASGTMKTEGFLVFKDGGLVDGDLKIHSNNFNFPSQKISGFELPLLMLYKFDFHAFFKEHDKTKMTIEKIDIGKNGSPIKIALKGYVLSATAPSSFMNSALVLNGPLQFTPQFLNSFSFLSMLLPPGHADGKFLMKIQGSLNNPGTPQFQ